MQIPFLQRLQALARPTVDKVVPAGSSPESVAAEQLLQQVLAGLPELIGAAVVQIDSGQTLASYTTAREFNISKVVGFNAEVIRQQRLAMQALLLPAEEQLEEILITLQTQLHLSRLLPDGQCFLYAVVDSRDTNLGIARTVLRTCNA